VFSRPDIPNVPGAAMSVKGSFARVDMNKDGEIQRQEWDAARAVIASMKDVLARNDFGENIFASPAIVDGVIYVRTPSALLAFSAK